MAALLRQGVRRFGGSVFQRTQAAVISPTVAEERRRLLPRRMTTVENSRTRPADETQQMKEELYEVLSNVGTMGERGLLQDLAVHVNPWPQDMRWRGLRVARRIGNFVETTGTALFVSLVVVVNGVYGSYYAAVERARGNGDARSSEEAGFNGEGKSSGDSDGEPRMTEINILS